MKNKLKERIRVLTCLGMVAIYLAGCFANNSTLVTLGSKTSQPSSTVKIRPYLSETATISTPVPLHTESNTITPSPELTSSVPSFTTSTFTPNNSGPTLSSILHDQASQEIVIGFGHGIYYVFDPKTGIFSPINPDIYKLSINNVYSWSKNGNRCTLISRDNKLNIIEIDLQGNIQRKISSYNQLSTLLPDGKILMNGMDFARDNSFFSFFNGRDNCHPGQDDLVCDTFDAYVYNIKNGTLKLVLEKTQSLMESWSAQGDLTLVKQDESGVDQVYIYQSGTDTLKQITNFRNPDNKIVGISYSPSGEKLGVIWDIWDGKSHIIKVSILVRQKNEVYLEDANNFGGTISWWIDDNRFIAFYRDRPTEFTIEDISLHSYIKIPLSDSGSGLLWAGPLTNPEQVGYFDREGDFHIFDISSMTEIYKVKTNIPIIQDYFRWVPLPSQFSDANSCTK